ncbi:MAG: methionyl-tRNA formyltransferase [bacterium]|nr:methionyl-tRNA formyltransferase [bacterium]
MRIAFWGTSGFIGSRQTGRFLRRLVASGIRPAVVVTAEDAPRGRDQEPVTAAVKSAALEFGLPVLQPSRLHGFSQELARLEIELSLVVAYGKILPPDALAVPKFGSLNIHPSLLPRWRGPTPIQAALLAGDSVTGVTIIEMDAEMDHGPVVAQREFPLGGRAWTAPALSDALTDLGVELFMEVLEPWIAGRITPQPQNHALATYSHMFKKADGRIDWSRPAEEIERMTRALQPWPGAYTFWRRGPDELRLVIDAADIADAPRGAVSPGTVLPYGDGMGVQTGSGILLIRFLTPSGGRHMSADEFFLGHRGIIDTILP